MAGTTIAAPDAAIWVTDLLNAAYYARPPEERDVDDLRLAFCILSTRWHRGGGRRLRLTDLTAFHRAFVRRRLRRAGGVGRLTHADLLEGADRLFGGGFSDGYADATRRGWGIVFTSATERSRYRPEDRLRHARLGPLTPPVATVGDRVWSAYRPVPVPDVDLTLSRILTPENWPDHGADHGRFTPLRTGGLLDQTFEIEVVAGAGTRHPLLTRGYVTATRLEDATRPAPLAAMIATLDEGLAPQGDTALADGHEPIAVVQLTTHAGHFIGAAWSHLVLSSGPDGGALRDIGVWDPMRFPQASAFAHGGRRAQHAFWGEADAQNSMLHQFAAP